MGGLISAESNALKKSSAKGTQKEKRFQPGFKSADSWGWSKATQADWRKQSELSPLSVVETSDHNCVPQRIHPAAAVVHHSGQPGVDRLWTVAVTITQQLLVNPKKTHTTVGDSLNNCIVTSES